MNKFSPAQISRRLAIKRLGSLVIAAGTLPPAITSAQISSDINKKTFSSFIDVLLPADNLSASGTGAGVSSDLLEFTKKADLYWRLASLGCVWLDTTGADGLGSLSTNDQIKIVEWMAKSDWNNVPRRFYHLTRQAAMSLYFSGAYATSGLPLNETPQPIGYAQPW